jgi:hypothetical protein
LGGTVSSIMSNLIRSIAANFDSFVHILNELNHPFSIIGLTETKLNTSREELSNQYLFLNLAYQMQVALAFLLMII